MHTFQVKIMRLLPFLLISLIFVSSCVPENTGSKSKSETNFKWIVQEITDSTLININLKSEIVSENKDLTNDVTMGFGKGDTFPNVILYNKNTTPYILYDELKKGKPILLVSGSISCPIFRRKVSKVDSLAKLYISKIETYIVYTTEAHPCDIASPYRDSVWLTKINQLENIRVDQSRTFGERVATSKNMQALTGVEAPILFDGPDNAYWHKLGQAPVFSYVILPNGKIADYQKNLKVKRLSNFLSNL